MGVSPRGRCQNYAFKWKERKQKKTKTARQGQANYSWIIPIMAASEEAARSFAESVGFIRRERDRAGGEGRAEGGGPAVQYCGPRLESDVLFQPSLWHPAWRACFLLYGHRGAPAVNKMCLSQASPPQRRTGLTGPEMSRTGLTGPQQGILGPEEWWPPFWRGKKGIARGQLRNHFIIIFFMIIMIRRQRRMSQMSSSRCNTIITDVE